MGVPSDWLSHSEFFGARFQVAPGAVGVLVIALALPLLQTSPAHGQGDILEVHDTLDDLDNRAGSIAPTAAQKTIANNLKATVRWNRFGTVQSMIKYGGYLASVSGVSAEDAARKWITSNKALFRLSSVTSSNLVLLNDSPMVGTKGHAVTFVQRAGNLQLAQDGMITIGITGTKAAGWKIGYVSSSAVGATSAPQSATLTPTAAWLKAADNVGRALPAGNISNVRQDGDWTVFNVTGFGGVQRSRLVAIGDPGDPVKAAYETIVLDVRGGHSEAYTIFVDARTGAIIFRTNRVAHLQAAPGEFGVFTGTTGVNGLCGPDHPIPTDADTKSITVAASADVPVNDIVVNIVRNGTVVASSDTLFSPEAVTYSESPFPPGAYAARVCEFEDVQNFSYTGAFTVSDVAAPEAFPYPPFWRYFEANPPLNLADDDMRILACWDAIINGQPVPGCELELENLAARAPWDHDIRSNSSTFTTIGNAAVTGEAWFSPLTPAEQYRPVNLERMYNFAWDNRWQNEKCSPTVFTPGPSTMPEPSAGGNDIDAATTSLFANHNRMHDWSYFLGFTEENYNMQQNNFGNTSPTRENDPEIGNSQAGAVDGGFPSYTGRDNANQITLNDGIPGITNMYLWQPIAGGFYAPCVDGDFDMSVIGHEYTHAISNRMVGGPDAGLTSGADGQARAMGESYSDLTAVEYLLEYDLVPNGGENPFAVGPYVTGNKQTGIRNYGMNNSPLNFSNVQGYDGMGSGSPHDDGEIWSAANYDIRKDLIAKYNGSFPASNTTLQRRCADNELPVDRCPGNRRWMQIVFDAYLLMPPSVSMLDSRDAYLAADFMRSGNTNQTILWRAFGRRGMGQFANSDGTDDPQPKPSFESPRQGDESTLTFNARAIDEGRDPVNATIYVGDYEANVTPAADTDPSTTLSNQVKLLPGQYRFVVQADGYGEFRFVRNIRASRTQTITLNMPTNWASVHKGATADDDDGANNEGLIDDTEATNWASLANGAPVDTVNPKITVDLAGNQSRLVDTLTVSSLLRAADAGNEQDSGSQNRFTALRKFRIETCNNDPATSINECDNETGIGFTPVFTSADDAFDAGVPRPLAPDLIFKNFNVTNSMATHVRLVVLENQCTGTPEYQGEQDNDPLNNTDCKLFSGANDDVRVAELQVFSRSGDLGVPLDPVVAMTMSAPATAGAGNNITYQIGYTNLGPATSSNAKIVDVLPAGVTFVSATGGGSYNASTRTVTWNLGDVPVGASGTRSLTVKVDSGVTVGTTIFNQAEFIAPLTVATPAAAATVITN